MSNQSEALKERAMLFALKVLRLVDNLPRSLGVQVCGRQLAESATSVGANYIAACTARSRPEFIAKLCIVNEESDESIFWLELIRRAGYLPSEEVSIPLQEARELRAIFGRSLSTARFNLRQKKAATGACT